MSRVPAPSPAWLWPQWLERQLDPAHPAFVPGDRAWNNVTGRRWTELGTPAGSSRVAVDGCGLVWPMSASWTLDWWIGAEDRWRLPSRDATVRQSLVDGEPVVETVVRVPGGDARARAYVVAGDGADTVVVEVEADTAVPFALAWALRPVTLDGPGRIDTIAVDDSVVSVDGQPVLWLPGRPGRVALAGAEGWSAPDAADVVLTGQAHPPEAAGDRVAGVDGAATGAFVFPVSHRSTITARMVVPAQTADAARRSPWRKPARTAATHGTEPAPAPGAATVARGWRSLAERSTRLVLPDGPLAAAVERQRRHLVLAATAVGDPSPEAALVVVASVQAGTVDAVAPVLSRWFGGDTSTTADRSVSATAASLWVLDELAALGATAVDERWLPAVAERAERLGRARPRPDDRDGGDVEVEVWRRAGLRAAATVLAGAGESQAAGQIAGWLPAEPVALGLRVGAVPETSGRVRGAPDAALAALVALGPLDLDHEVDGSEVLAAIGPSVRDGQVVVGSPPDGISPAATLRLAAVRPGDGPRLAEDSERALAGTLDTMSPTGAWPAVVVPATGSGASGSGHDPAAAAALWSALRRLLVVDRPGSPVVALAPVWPAAWWGVPVEVHGLPSRVGAVSYAVRWHGHRPALLWDITADGPVTVTSPGFDPAWSSTEPRGEALFDLPAPVDGPAFT